MKVVVGLGNPGAKYAGTRHNVGFAVIDLLAQNAAGFRGKFQAQLAELHDGGETLLLVKPETFMNLSGRSVRQALDFHKVEAADLLVVCDDINLHHGIDVCMNRFNSPEGEGGGKKKPKKEQDGAGDQPPPRGEPT